MRVSRLAPLVLLAALLAAWEIACRALHVAPYLLPAPSSVAVALREHFPVLVAAAWRTLSVALIALVIASLVAQALAFLTALTPVVKNYPRPVLP